MKRSNERGHRITRDSLNYETDEPLGVWTSEDIHVVDSTLYFIRRDSDGAIKIGITTDLRRRFSDLRRQYGGMTLLGIVVGAATREKLAHLIFADTRLDGEFFQPTSGLLSLVKQYAVPPPVIHDTPLKAEAPRASHTRPWIDLYSDPLAVYDREQFVRDYERWIARRLVSLEKRRHVEIFRSFPTQMVFVPQSGLSGWGWTPLNPRCWTDLNGRRLYEGGSRKSALSSMRTLPSIEEQSN